LTSVCDRVCQAQCSPAARGTDNAKFPSSHTLSGGEGTKRRVGAQAEKNFETLINTLTYQLDVYRKAELKKKQGIDDDDDELAAQKKAEAEAKKKVLLRTPAPRASSAAYYTLPVQQRHK